MIRRCRTGPAYGGSACSGAVRNVRGHCGVACTVCFAGLVRRTGFIVLVGIVVPFPAHADSSGKSEPDPVAGLSNLVTNAQLALRVSADPVLRGIVCRVPYALFSLDSLAGATGLPMERIASALSDLVVMGLVMLETDLLAGNVLVVSVSDAAQKAMREWAEMCCANDDSCGVKT